MSELTDLNATGNGLSAVSGGLQGLLEAYKMKMAQSVEQAKINQQGLDAGAQARMMMPYRMVKLDQEQQKIDQTVAHQTETERIAALTAGSPEESAAVMARETLNGNFDPAIVPKRGAIFSNYILELDRQSKGNPQLLAAAEAAKAKMYAGGAAAQGVTRSIDSLGPVVDSLKTQLGFNPQTGAYDGPSAQGDVPAMNRAKSYLGYQTGVGDPRKDIKNSVQIIQDEAKNLSRNGSDKNMALAAGLMDADAPRGDLIKGLNAFNDGLLASRKTGYSFSGTPAPVMPAAPAAPAAPVTPAIHPVVAAALAGGAPAPVAPGKYDHLTPQQMQDEFARQQAAGN